MTDPLPPKTPQRYRWPRFLIAAVILGLVLMILWMVGAVRRVRRIRESTTGSASLILFGEMSAAGSGLLPPPLKKGLAGRRQGGGGRGTPLKKTFCQPDQIFYQ